MPLVAQMAEEASVPGDKAVGVLRPSWEVTDSSRVTWRKAARSQGTGAECVEIARVWLPEEAWRKASRSTGSGSDCVEVARMHAGVAVRDSKDPSGPKLTFSRQEFARFAEAVRRGRYDL